MLSLKLKKPVPMKGGVGPGTSAIVVSKSTLKVIAFTWEKPKASDKVDANTAALKRSLIKKTFFHSKTRSSKLPSLSGVPHTVHGATPAMLPAFRDAELTNNEMTACSSSDQQQSESSGIVWSVRGIFSQAKDNPLT